MKHATLYELIQYIQYGTKLHIGVLFFGSYGNDMCVLPREHKIHSGKICTDFKQYGQLGFNGCFKCRNLAIKKAMREKIAFGGLCINGVYEYTHPVIINGDVACIIYIGNIFDEKGGEKIYQLLGENADVTANMETDFDEKKCEGVCRIIEGHIRLLLEEYNDKTDKFSPVIENIKSYIDSNLEFDIDISHIASIFHYNEQYLGRLFKKETSLSISEYITARRVEKAKELLKTTDDSVIDISGKTGFNTVTYFNRKFKGLVHMTPTQYRNR